MLGEQVLCALLVGVRLELLVDEQSVVSRFDIELIGGVLARQLVRESVFNYPSRVA